MFHTLIFGANFVWCSGLISRVRLVLRFSLWSSVRLPRDLQEVKWLWTAGRPSDDQVSMGRRK